MNYKARAERAEQNLRTSKPEISAAHREQLAFLAALQISDLLDSLLEMDTSIESYETVVVAIAARGTALALAVITSAMSDQLANDNAMIRHLAPHQDVDEFRDAKPRDSLPWTD